MGARIIGAHADVVMTHLAAVEVRTATRHIHSLVFKSERLDN
jgi:hypothetical protein